MHSSIDKLNIVKNKVNKIIKEKQLKTNPKIIIISKTFSIDKIKPLIENKHIHFGENKVQEAEDKWSETRNLYKELQLHMVGKLQTHITSAAIGVTGDFIERAQELVQQGCKIPCIDVAHGHHKLVKESIRRIKNEVNGQVDLLVGNISTGESARDLCEWGADGLRIGIGGGSLCSTRIQTGVGVPMVSSIRDCVDVADGYNVPCMADGGIRSSGDVCKGLGAGADTVMLGSLLSGTKESPGSITKQGQWPNEVLQKKYRGSASIESKTDRGESKNVEGYSTTVPYKGKVKRIISDVIYGLKSSMSYVGANNLKEF